MYFVLGSTKFTPGTESMFGPSLWSEIRCEVAINGFHKVKKKTHKNDKILDIAARGLLGAG